MKKQYEASLKRISELEQQHDKALQQACQGDLALQHKEAELLAAQQSIRSAVVEQMKRAPASGFCGKWQTTQVLLRAQQRSAGNGLVHV